jgi:ubiquinone biosynthesis protein
MSEAWVQIPRVPPELTTSRMITLERIRGMKITDLAALGEAGLDRHALAERTALIVAKMIFHADPHPGNFFIEPTGRVGIVDFGMVGTDVARKDGREYQPHTARAGPTAKAINASADTASAASGCRGVRFSASRGELELARSEHKRTPLARLHLDH